MMNEKKLKKEQKEEEQALLCYMNYLKNGYLSKQQRETIEMFDQKQTEFEQIAFRLEAIERVRLYHKENSLYQYKKILEKMYTNYQNLSDLLKAEYTRMGEVEEKEITHYENCRDSQEFEIE